MKIGSITLENPFVLAPLAGYTDLPFRLLCREYGAGLVYSEMISCHGLVYRQPNTFKMLQTVEQDRPVSFQLFGSDPEIMAEAAIILSELPIDLIDINMGCPVRKVTKKGAGSALMKTPKLAEKIIRGVCKQARIGVTVKIRSGWNHQSLTAPEFARMAEDAGVAAIAVHGRTWSDGFSGSADRRIIAAVKEAVSIPVIGNGDILSYGDGLKMMAETGCDGVMVGRGALGRPWIFMPNQPEPGLTLRLTALKRHLDLIASHRSTEFGLAAIKNHAGRYFKGMPHGAAIRNQIYQTNSFSELQQLINSFNKTLHSN
ncbi:MAG: tRNA dihydrouridine synthase DusB [Thermodesulfobacteriota bacterium]|nr:tRNA dihydrouridine synthase DusB [Thermodesulfobacteriota bacterium]